MLSHFSVATLKMTGHPLIRATLAPHCVRCSAGEPQESITQPGTLRSVQSDMGNLGYKNARFGRIESHEVLTKISRELLLQAKEVAEEMGFTVLHMYVDGLFVQRAGTQEKMVFEPLLNAIYAQTKILIALDGIYR